MQQLRAIIPVILGNLRLSRWSSLVVVGCVTLVTLILAAFLAMAQGFASTAETAGSDDLVVMLGRQSQSEANSQITREQIELLANAPGIARIDDQLTISPELTMTVSGKRREDGNKVNATLRGMNQEGLAVRAGLEIIEGRGFETGRSEVIVGRKLAATMDGVEVGKTIVLSGREWNIVGIYKLQSDVFETEFYADLGTLQSAYGRENQIQSVRAYLTNPEALPQLQSFMANEPRLDLEALTERELYAEQVKGTTNLILILGWPLAIILAVGATAGVFNTMLIVLEGRRHSLRTLSMLGFTRSTVLGGVIVETVILSLIGAFIGLAIVYLAMQGAESTMVGQGFATVSYKLALDGWAVLQALTLATVIGILGGLIPGAGLLKRKGV